MEGVALGGEFLCFSIKDGRKWTLPSSEDLSHEMIGLTPEGIVVACCPFY